MKRNKQTRKMKQAVTEADHQHLAKRGKLINRLVEVGKRFKKPEKLDRQRLAKLTNEELVKLLEEEAANLRLIEKEKTIRAEGIEARRQLYAGEHYRNNSNYVAKVSIWFKPFGQVANEARSRMPQGRSTMALTPSEALKRLNAAHNCYEKLAVKASQVVKSGGRLPKEEGLQMAAALLERQEMAQYLRGLK